MELITKSKIKSECYVRVINQHIEHNKKQYHEKVYTIKRYFKYKIQIYINVIKKQHI